MRGIPLGEARDLPVDPRERDGSVNALHKLNDRIGDATCLVFFGYFYTFFLCTTEEPEAGTVHVPIPVDGFTLKVTPKTLPFASGAVPR